MLDKNSARQYGAKTLEKYKVRAAPMLMLT
jgi:hypothetical protein